MSEGPITPDWQRLPHDAVGFFGLQTPFERRDLKRRYNEFIRQFKPEKFPQEFQRIRAAYEQLDLGLRYGDWAGQQAMPSDEYQWHTDAASNGPSAPTMQPPIEGRSPNRTPETSPTGSARVSPAPLHERVRTESVSQLYAELAGKTRKTAYDFYALAVLSDVVDKQDDELQFLGWLLKGLIAHPHDLGLLRLLHEYVRGPLPEGAAAKLLLSCSKAVREDVFFPLTEPLWQGLLSAGDFATFRATLAECEANLKGLNIVGRIVFTIQILKSAMWQADDAWIDEKLQYVETNFDQIPRFLEYDVEIVSALRAYMICRQEFLTGHPLREQLDKALRHYFTEDQTIGDRSILERQIRVSQDTDALREAFWPPEHPAYAPFYNLWSWISFDVAERHVATKQQPDETELWFSRTKTLLAQMVRQNDNSRLGLFWYAAAFGWFCLQSLCYVCSFLVVGLASALVSNVFALKRQNDGVIAIISVCAMVGSICLTYWLIKRFVKPRLWLPFNRRMAARCYRAQWQPEVMNFLARSHVPYHMFTQFLAHAMTTDKSTSQWIQYHVGKDYSLAMYSVAQRFVI